jgi:hypothetical protein
VCLGLRSGYRGVRRHVTEDGVGFGGCGVVDLGHDFGYDFRDMDMVRPHSNCGGRGHSEGRHKMLKEGDRERKGEGG